MRSSPRRAVALPDSAVLTLYLQLGDDARGASLDQMRCREGEGLPRG